MFVVVQLDVYNDGDCDCYNSGTVTEIFGPFPDRVVAEAYQRHCDSRNLYATVFEIRPVVEPTY